MPHARLGHPPPADLRLHRGGAARPAHADGQRPAPSRSARWAPTRPIAVLSDRPRLLFDYFSQLFAQVTNPPLDAIREELVTSLPASIGPEANLLDADARRRCRQVVLPFPVIDNDELAKIRAHQRRRRPARLRHARRPRPVRRRRRRRGAAPRGSTRSAPRCPRRSRDGARIIVLSDRDSDADCAPIPSLLLTGAVHHHLVREKTRTQVGLVVEAGDVREVHHVALLIGYGAAAVNPYLAMETVEDLAARPVYVTGVEPERAVTQPGQGARQGRAQGDVARWASRRSRPTPARRSSRRSGSSQELVDDVLHRHHLPARRRRPRRARRGGRAPAPAWPTRATASRPRTATSRSAASTSGAARASCTCSTRRRCSGCSTPPAPGATTSSSSTPQPVDEQAERLMTLRGLFRFDDGARARRSPIDEVEPVVGDRQAVLHRRDVLRLDLAGGARDARDRDEPARRQVQHRRGRRGRRPAARPGSGAVGDQAGRVRPVRRHQRVPGQRRRHPDQDGAGREARRGRPAARPQGLPVDRQDPALDARASA